MFSACYNLQSVPLLNCLSAIGNTPYSNMFNGCYNLKQGAIQATASALSYADANLSPAELNRIFSNLSTVPSGRSATITVTNNWGASVSLGCNPAGATAKGWTVTGVGS